MTASASADETRTGRPRPLRGSGASQTDWSMIMAAAEATQPQADEALDRLARRYWPAIYAWLRSSGRDVHEAADLTQAFICDVLLERNLLLVADPRRGRFRSLLLTALKNFVREQHRRATRRKRAVGGRPPVQLDPAAMASTKVAPGRTPDDAFIAQWGITLIHQVLEDVRGACLADGLGPHWSVFELRVARPMLFGQPAAEYDALVEQLDLESASQAANMLVTVKRRFVRALVAEVRRTVDDPSQVEDELLELLREMERPK